jgi:NAD(P)-dependent dehydrogenase (short-subunit alcohol dehydrogenase family)
MAAEAPGNGLIRGTVLVTGAARGLGLEFARQYLAAGWRVLACARDTGRSSLADLAAREGEALEVFSLDVRDLDSISNLAASLHGISIDVLLNVAGTMGQDGVSDDYIGMGFGHTSYTDWDDVLRTNVFGPMRLVESLIESVAASRERKIVNLTSVLGSIGSNGLGGLYAYRSSKAALNAITRSMAVDMLPYDITVIALHPGWVRTDMGGANAQVDPVDSVGGMRAVISGVSRNDSGRFLSWNGSEIPW